MNRLLIRGNSASTFGRAKYQNSIGSHKLVRLPGTFQSTRLFASNKNYGSDSQENLVKAKLTLQDGSVYEGYNKI